MSDNTVRYVGRAYDVVSYESIVPVETPTTVEALAAATEKALAALKDVKPGVFNVRTKIEVGFGYRPSIFAVAAGEIYDCIECGGQGHRPDDCPTKKSE